MKLLNELISTDYGLMSLIVILVVIVMAVYFTILFMGKVSSSSAEQARKAGAGVPAPKR